MRVYCIHLAFIHITSEVYTAQYIAGLMAIGIAYKLHQYFNSEHSSKTLLRLSRIQSSFKTSPEFLSTIIASIQKFNPHTNLWVYQQIPRWFILLERTSANIFFWLLLQFFFAKCIFIICFGCNYICIDCHDQVQFWCYLIKHSSTKLNNSIKLIVIKWPRLSA